MVADGGALWLSTFSQFAPLHNVRLKVCLNTPPLNTPPLPSPHPLRTQLWSGESLHCPSPPPPCGIHRCSHDLVTPHPRHSSYTSVGQRQFDPPSPSPACPPLQDMRLEAVTLQLDAVSSQLVELSSSSGGAGLALAAEQARCDSLQRQLDGGLAENQELQARLSAAQMEAAGSTEVSCMEEGHCFDVGCVVSSAAFCTSKCVLASAVLARRYVLASVCVWHLHVGVIGCVLHVGVCFARRCVFGTSVCVWHVGVCLASVCVWHVGVCLASVCDLHVGVCLASVCVWRRVYAWRRCVFCTSVCVWRWCVLCTSVYVWRRLCFVL